MTSTDLEAIRRAISEVCAAYEEPDSHEALACAFYQLRRVRDNVLPRCEPTGRNGGKSRSPALQAARRANGAKGGRPKKVRGPCATPTCACAQIET